MVPPFTPQVVDPETATPPVQTPQPSVTYVVVNPYLGQEPPGMEPVIFAPGIVSDPDYSEYSGTFSPDGSEYFFYRYSRSSGSFLLFNKIIDREWSVPEQFTVTAGYDAFEPHLSSDNQRLYFNWEHPVPSR